MPVPEKLKTQNEPPVSNTGSFSSLKDMLIASGRDTIIQGASLSAGGATNANGGAMTGALSGGTTDMNNRQLHPNEKRKLDALKLGESTEEQQKLDAASCYLVHCEAQYAIGSAEYNREKAKYDLGATLVTEQNLLKGTGLFTYTTTGKFSDKSIDASDQKNGVYLKLIDATNLVYNVKDVPTMPDYITASGSVGSFAGGTSLNLHNGEMFIQLSAGSDGSKISLKAGGASVNAGWIQGGSNAQDTNDFLQGFGGSAAMYIPITPVIGIGGGLNHSYGGKTAVELGVGKPGVGISPIGLGQ